jgi:hypothetical protein
VDSVNKNHLCVQEAIEEVAVLNPEYGLVKMNPTSFIYFIRNLGSNTKLFCEWKNKQTKILRYYTGAVDIDIQVRPLNKESTAYFMNKKTKDIIEVRLSG